MRHKLAHFEYRFGSDLPTDEVLDLYADAGWLENADSSARIEAILRNSYLVCAAYAQNGRLAGMMRALSDGVSDAYLVDLVVRREFREQGIGHSIVAALSEHLSSQGVGWIVCIGVPGTEHFYGSIPGASPMASHTPWRFSAAAGGDHV